MTTVLGIDPGKSGGFAVIGPDPSPGRREILAIKMHATERDIWEFIKWAAEHVDVCYIDGDDEGGSVGDPGDSVRVSATFGYDLAIVGPVLSGLFQGNAGTIIMTPSATARLERTVSGAAACA